MSITYPSEVIPEIDWENSLTSGLVALYMVVNGVVTDIVSGIQGTGVYETGLDNWTGEAEFDLTNAIFPELNNVGDSISIQAVGIIKSGNDSTLLRLSDASGTQLLSISSGYNSTSAIPNIRARGMVFADAQNAVTEDKFDTLGIELTSVNALYGAYPRYSALCYNSGLLLPFSALIARTQGDLVKLTVGTIGVGTDYIAVYNRSRLTEEYDAIDSNPYSLFKTRQAASSEYCLALLVASMELTIPFTGVWSGVLLLASGTSTSIDGSGVYTLTGALDLRILSIEVTDELGYHYFEFNQQSGSVVVDHYSDVMCTLTGTDDTNWQLVIPVDVYTVGAGKDYDSISSLNSANIGHTNHIIARVHGRDINCAGYLKTTKPGILEIVGAASPFDGSNGFTCDSITGTMNQYGSGELILNNLELKGAVPDTGGVNRVTADMVLFNGEGTRTNSGTLNKTGSYFHATRSIFTGFRAYQALMHYGSSTSQKVSDCLFIDNNITAGGNYGAISSATALNCIAYNCGRSHGAAARLENTLVDDKFNSSYTTSSQANVDFTGAFVDPINGDYRINQAWADTMLKGKGWNNSDIAKWAWFSGVQVIWHQFTKLVANSLSKSVAAKSAIMATFADTASLPILREPTVTLATTAKPRKAQAGTRLGSYSASMVIHADTFSTAYSQARIDAFAVRVVNTVVGMFTIGRVETKVSPVKATIGVAASYASTSVTSAVQSYNGYLTGYFDGAAQNKAQVYGGEPVVSLVHKADVSKILVGSYVDYFFRQLYNFAAMKKTSVSFSHTSTESAYSFNASDTDIAYTVETE